MSTNSSKSMKIASQSFYRKSLFRFFFNFLSVFHNMFRKFSKSNLPNTPTIFSLLPEITHVIKDASNPFTRNLIQRLIKKKNTPLLNYLKSKIYG